MTRHDEERLRAGLQALSREMNDDPQVPARTEQMLRAAFRHRHRRVAQPAWWQAAAALAFAAATVLAVVRWPVPPADPLTLERPAAAVPPALQPLRPAVPAPVRIAVRPARRPAPRPGVMPTPSRQQPVRPREVELATEFLPVTGAEFLPPAVRGQLVRVQVPRSTMRSFGLPVIEERASERIKADLLLGDDGLARAVRFVK